MHQFMPEDAESNADRGSVTLSETEFGAMGNQNKKSESEPPSNKAHNNKADKS